MNITEFIHFLFLTYSKYIILFHLYFVFFCTLFLSFWAMNFSKSILYPILGVLGTFFLGYFAVYFLDYFFAGPYFESLKLKSSLFPNGLLEFPKEDFEESSLNSSQNFFNDNDSINSNLWFMFGFPGIFTKLLIGDFFNFYGLDLAFVLFICGLFSSDF